RASLFSIARITYTPWDEPGSHKRRSYTLKIGANAIFVYSDGDHGRTVQLAGSSDPRSLSLGSVDAKLETFVIIMGPGGSGEGYVDFYFRASRLPEVSTARTVADRLTLLSGWHHNGSFFFLHELQAFPPYENAGGYSNLPRLTRPY